MKKCRRNFLFWGFSSSVSGNIRKFFIPENKRKASFWGNIRNCFGGDFFGLRLGRAGYGFWNYKKKISFEEIEDVSLNYKISKSFRRSNFSSTVDMYYNQSLQWKRKFKKDSIHDNIWQLSLTTLVRTENILWRDFVV